MLGGGVPHEEVVDVEAGIGWVLGAGRGESEATGGIGLGIAVDEEGWEAFEGEGGGEIDGGGGLAYSPFLVDYSDDFAGPGGERRGSRGVGCRSGGLADGFIGGMNGDHCGK